MFKTLVDYRETYSKPGMLIKKNKPNIVFFSELDKAVASMEFLGFGKSKEERDSEKLEKARVDFIEHMKTRISASDHQKEIFDKDFVLLENALNVLESTIKNKKMNHEKFKDLYDKHNDWIIRWTDGLESLKKLQEYNSDLKKLIEIPLISSEKEVPQQNSEIKVLTSRLATIESVFEKVLYDDDSAHKSTYKAAGYDESSIKTIVSYKNMIISEASQLSILIGELSRLAKSMIDHSSKVNDISVFHAFYNQWSMAQYYIESIHHYEIVIYLVNYSLRIVKDCYE